MPPPADRSIRTDSRKRRGWRRDRQNGFRRAQSDAAWSLLGSWLGLWLGLWRPLAPFTWTDGRVTQDRQELGENFAGSGATPSMKVRHLAMAGPAASATARNAPSIPSTNAV